MSNRKSFLVLSVVIIVAITAINYGCSAPVNSTPTTTPPVTRISKYTSASNMGIRLTVDVSDIQPKPDETVNISITLDDVSNNSVQPGYVIGGPIEIKNQGGQVVWSTAMPRIPTASTPTLPSASSSNPEGNIPATPRLWSINSSYSWVVNTDPSIGIAVSPGKYYLNVTDSFYPNTTAQQTVSISVQPIEITVQ